MNPETQKKVGLAIGIPFTLVVVGLIVYGNFFAHSSNPVMTTWEYRPALYICDTAPDWVRPDSEDVAKALQFWEDRGWAFGNITSGPCPDLCTGRDEDGNETKTTCLRGTVALDLFDGKHWKEDHAGVCVKPDKATLGASDWATIMVPMVIYGADDFALSGDDFPAGATPMLPSEVNAKVLAHEVGHCLVGLGHNVGPVVIPGLLTLNPKTGHVMNPNIYNGGWGDESLPPAPSGWE